MLGGMRDFLAYTRRCATCHWWEGERIADTLNGRVELPRHAGMGYCRSPVSWWLGRPRQGDSLCAFWRQWERVRGLGHGPGHLGLVMLGPAMRHAHLPQFPEA
jgi:hypothetical protein